MSSLRGMQVLVVENDDMNAMLLEMQLTQAGASVLGPAGTVADALALVDASSPDIAILDYRLGDDETSEGVAETLYARGIPFVLATGLPAHSLPSAFDKGIVLTKPYLAEELVKALAKAQERTTADN